MVKVIFGMMGSYVAGGSKRIATPQQVSDVLSVVKRHNIRELDTARVYNGGRSEELLGECSAGKDFAISTKVPAFSPGSLSASNIESACNASLKALKQDKIDIYYFHGPDRQTTYEESCQAIDKLYKEGKFERFGVSNLHVDEVRKIHSICKKEGYVLPSVYQGGYNPAGRSVEELLLPTLRELGMVFYAFSPLGGGFFTRPVEELRNPPKGGRMDQMKVFKDIYVNDKSLQLLQELTETCQKHGFHVKEATLRWFMHHSALGEEDGVILGASSQGQAEENLKACEGGKLPEDVVEGFGRLWTEREKGAWGYCSEPTGEERKRLGLKL